MKIFKFLTLVCISSLLLGCASATPFIDPYYGYEGSAKNSNETATVFILNYGSSGYSGLHGYISHVDSKSTMGVIAPPAPIEVFVLPGNHKFSLVAGDGLGRRADGEIAFDTTAGHTYEIIGEMVGANSVSWHVKDHGLYFIRTDEVYKNALKFREQRKK